MTAPKPMNTSQYVWLCFLIFIPSILFAQEELSTPCQKAEKIISTIEDYHYSPRERDREWSSDVFKIWIDLLDPNKNTFTEEQLSNWSEMQHSINSYISDQDCSLIQTIKDSYIAQYEQLAAFNQDMDLNGLDLNVNEAINLKTDRPKNNDDLKNYYRKYMKYRLIDKLVNGHEEAQSMADIGQDQLEEQFALLRSKQECRFSSAVRNKEELGAEVESAFLRAVGLAYDPHTSYMDQEESMQFISGLSQESISYGLHIDQNDDEEIMVSRVLPGGSAWATEKIVEGDIITKIEAEGAEMIDLTCLRSGEIMSWLEDLSGNTSTFHVTHSNGDQGEYTLEKNYAGKDFSQEILPMVLSDEDQNIAYVSIPSFYQESDQTQFVQNGTANDLAKLLLKMTHKDQIDGLIVDLRFNGGGHLLEALRLAGMFINYGSVSVSEYRDSDAELLKDPDRGVLYDGPLVVLVNAASASASEMFSSAMQDYNRAVIVGDTTYGKGTIQTFIPLNGAIESGYEEESLDLINMTIGKFYRPNQSSVQNSGVIPDITLPDFYNLFEIGERYETAALQSSKTDKKTYYKPYEKLPIDQLKSRSMLRIENQKYFRELNKLLEFDLSQAIDITWDGIKKRNDRFEKLGSPTESDDERIFEARIPSHLDDYEISEFRMDYLNEQSESISQDPYIQECWNIINDIIKL